MKYDTIYQVRGQFNGGYLPDHFALFGSYREAVSYAHELAHEYGTVHREQWDTHTVAYFVRDDWQKVSTAHDSYPYYFVVEPISWRAVADDLGVTTRREVLDADIDPM